MSTFRVSFQMPLAALLLCSLSTLATGQNMVSAIGQSTNAGPMALASSTNPQIHFSNAFGEPGEEGDSAIALGDFNRDGKVDVVVSHANFGGVSIMLGLPDGHGDATYLTGSGSDEALVADFNHDGNLDLAVGNGTGNTVSILLGNGDGSFRSANDVLLAGDPKAIAVADFNRDGFADLAVMDCIPDGRCNLVIFHGNAAGNLTFAQRILLPGPPNMFKGQMVAVDFNRDGRPDLALVAGNTEAMIFTDTLAGKLQLHSSFKLPNASIGTGMAWGSFNNDALPDLVFRVMDVCGQSCSFANSIYIFLNTGSGDFVRSERLGMSKSANGGFLAVMDVNGDNKQDILTLSGNGFDPVVEYALGRGNGMFDSAVRVLVLPDQPPSVGLVFPSGLVTRDVNFDSRHDFGTVSLDTFGQDLAGWTIFSNDNALTNCPPPNSARLAARICSPVTETHVASTVTIRGAGNSPAGVKRMELWIDGKKRFEEWNDQLLATVPLTKGRHLVTVEAVDQDDSFSPSHIFVNVP
jgi:hypothetical protein